jgi:heme-degrading monooxygenase HmoA
MEGQKWPCLLIFLRSDNYNIKRRETMNARIVLGQTLIDKKDEAIDIYRDSLVSAAKEQNGFKNAMLLTDPETGKFISITLWETEADMAAGEASGYYQEQIAKFGALFASPPTMEHYEVSVQE